MGRRLLQSPHASWAAPRPPEHPKWPNPKAVELVKGMDRTQGLQKQDPDVQCESVRAGRPIGSALFAAPLLFLMWPWCQTSKLMTEAQEKRARPKTSKLTSATTRCEKPRSVRLRWRIMASLHQGHAMTGTFSASEGGDRAATRIIPGARAAHGSSTSH